MQTILDIEDVKAYFASHKDEMLTDLFSIVRIPSVWKPEGDKDAPYGRGCKDALVACLKLFTDAGFDGVLSEDNRYALAFYGGNRIAESVGLFAHTDVVPAGEGWTLTDPFEPKLFDGYAIGRGIKDNKAGVILSLWILKYLREKKIPLARPITVFLGSAEEKEMTDIPCFVKKYGSPYVSLVPDSGYPISYGEKGIGRFRFVAKDAFRTALALEGGTAPNVVLGQAFATLPEDEGILAAIQAAAETHERITLLTDNGATKLRADGVAAHASAPANSINAGCLLCSLLEAVDALPEADRAVLTNAKQLLAVTDGSVADIAGTVGEFTPLTMTNGIIRTEEGRLCLTFDIRYTPHITPKELEQKMAVCAERYGFTSHVISNREGFLNPKDSPAVTAVLDTAELLSGVRPKPYLMGGGTYARCLKNAYSIGLTVPYIPNPFVAPKPGHGGAHEADEHLAIEPFIGAVVLAAEVVAKLACE